MNLTPQIATWLFLIFPVAVRAATVATLPRDNVPIQIPVEVVVDKIRGGLLGEMLGNLNGLPHEMKYIDKPGEVVDYIPSLPDGAWTDDDTDFEWIYIYEMQKRRKALLSGHEIASIWQEKINKRIWCANRYARYLMDMGFEPPLTGSTVLNPWSHFNLSGQFIAETFGIIAPAMPRTAAQIGLNYTTTTISGEPAQVTQFVTAMVATAFVENDINKILDAGIASLDPPSRIVQIVGDMRAWHREYSDDWREARRLLKEKYTYEKSNIRDYNGSFLNTGAIVGALLYGGGDFAESLRFAFNFGWDADCNAATLGAILGVKSGYRNLNGQGWRIVDRYKNTTRDGMPMDETITSYADRLIEVFEMINESNGGQKRLLNQVMVYEINQEVPAPSFLLESDGNLAAQWKEDHRQEIIDDLQSGSREARARAAYLAVCIGLNPELAERYPQAWDDAVYSLSGYWKVMNNIFPSIEHKQFDFESQAELGRKFIAAGFSRPRRVFTEAELYTDMTVWKDPRDLY